MCIVGHSGAAGHKGVDTTLNSIKTSCWCSDMEENVQTFCSSCLHCHANDHRVIPRPLGESLHGTTCNKGVHFGLISMHPLSSKLNLIFASVLIIKSDLSGFVESIPSGSPYHFVVDGAWMD